MSMTQRKSPTKTSRKIAVRKATGSEILSSLGVTRAEYSAAKKALESAKRRMGIKTPAPRSGG